MVVRPKHVAAKRINSKATITTLPRRKPLTLISRRRTIYMRSTERTGLAFDWFLVRISVGPDAVLRFSLFSSQDDVTFLYYGFLASSFPFISLNLCFPRIVWLLLFLIETTASDGIVIIEWWIGKYLEGSDRVAVMLLSWDFVGTKEDQWLG
jgi:hypothetical protein